MSFLDRLRSDIELTSPNGDVFNPKWVGNQRSKEKKIGVFEYPNVNGTKTQDLGINGTRYPLTLYFDGPDNDIESSRFYTSCDQTGTWQVLHPSKGEITLQLTSVTEDIQPVDSGTITVFETSWIEVITDGSTVSGVQLGATVSVKSVETNISCLQQLIAGIDLSLASNIVAVTNAIQNTVDVITDVFEDAVSTVESVKAEFDATIRGIEDTINAVVLDIETLGAQIQTLAQLPALALSTADEIQDLFTEAIDSVIALVPTSTGITNIPTSESKNSTVAYELGLTALVNAVTLSTINIDLETRTQVIELSESMVELLSNVTATLDIVQDNFSEQDIDQQYFSQSVAFSDLKVLIGTTLNYLTESLLGLKVEKRFTLEKPRSPIEITVTEYGTLEQYDFFVDTNKLSGKDILLLPAGREVVVYV